MNVEDINAVITGGSSGLGKATAEIILSNGGKATILDTQKDIIFEKNNSPKSRRSKGYFSSLF